jgi:hypothetical protein
MDQYIGLDVSLKDTAISVREGGKRIWRGKCPSDPKLLAELIRKHAPHARRVVFETGPLSTWFYHALTAEGVPAICIEARHAQKVLNEMTHELAQASPTLFADVVSNRWEVAAILGQLAIVEGVAPDLTIDRRSVTTELARHFFDRQFAFDEVVEAASIGQIQLRITS